MANVQISQWRLRVQADAERVGDPTFAAQNLLTGQALSIPRANGLALEFGFFFNGSPLDCSIFSDVEFHLWQAQNSPVLIMAQALAQGNAQFHNIIDPVAWAGASDQNAQFIFSSQDTNIALGGAITQTYWFEVKAKVTATGNWVTLVEGNFTIIESQAEQPSTPVPLPPDTVLGTQTARALYVQRQSDAARYRFNNTDQYFYDSADGLFHRVYVQGGQFIVEQPGLAAVPQP